MSDSARPPIAAIRGHADTVAGVADQIAQARAAAHEVTMGAEAYGQLCARDRAEAANHSGRGCLGLVEDAAQISNGIQNNSWVDGTLGGVGGSLNMLAMAIDPLGSLVSWGVAWLMEHVKPLQEALDWLAGNPDEVPRTLPPGRTSRLSPRIPTTSTPGRCPPVEIVESADDIAYLDFPGAVACTDDLGVQLGPAAFQDEETGSLGAGAVISRVA